MQPTGIRVSDIPEGASKGFALDGEKYLIVNKAGGFYVYRNSCPHIGIALEWVEDQFLDSTKSVIQCANHGALFVIETGKCVAGPCTGQKLHAVTHQIIDSEIYIANSNSLQV